MPLILLFALDLPDLGVLCLAESLSLVAPLRLLALVVGAQSVHLRVASALLIKQLVLVLVAHL
jgi:hypothetical protein